MPQKVYKVAIRLLIPAATLIAERGDLKCKPSELPIYTAESPKEQQEPKVVREPGPVEQQIGNVRKQVVSFVTQISDIQQHADNFYEDSKNQFNWLIKYLREEDNTTPRAGAIAIGGLTGFILGLRGGFFRRVVFTSGGALGMAALCYPKEAAQYSEIAVTETKKYVKIAYNFYHGVKKDDLPLELPSLPKLPSSLSEVWNLAKGSSSNQNLSVTVQESLAEVKTVPSVKAATK